jgi:signal peptidase II
MSKPLLARLAPWLGLAAIVMVLDQLTKIAVAQRFSYGERKAVTGFFDLTLLYNKGAAFSFLHDSAGWQRWLFAGIAVAASVFIVYLLARHPAQRLFAFALALILGGAVGNLVDRVLHGHVIDFLLVYYRDWYWPAFNLADSAICVGAALLVLDELLRVRKSK